MSPQPVRLELGEKADAHQPASSAWVGEQKQRCGVAIHAPQGEERGVFRAAEGAHRTPVSHNRRHGRNHTLDHQNKMLRNPGPR